MKQTRRNLLKQFGAAGAIGLGSVGLSGTASAHVQDPYADRWVAADSSNYSNTNRSSNSINWVVIHVTQGSYSGAVSWLQNPDSNVSAQYVMRNSDGHTTQMVHNEDTAWHAGGTNYNAHSVGIEHEGWVGETNFTDALYQKSANIVSWLCDTYGISKTHPTGVAPCDARDGSGIIGHHQVPESDCGYNDHTDPGSTWDWNYFMSLVNGDSGGGGGNRFADGDRVTPTANLNTREQPGTDQPIVATISPSEVGEIMNGPIDKDGYTWWGVHWLDRNVWGWSVEQYLTDA
ncbi:N-acetylmuramoyl-L-alanine amidase [Haladaptatus litoreus]|uniref:N-acetylmuramoyl-L-alanine amidase n=1 Tax=Haladaptatus litoreus TaxID=553468 RepID=A0A1N7BF30_9EURY|nr:N-acetylmuramoyl-L-alanine amidase [Haladaptatus litoreus]SIR49813.1 N-acetylmuramoyl-L-alanine amidase [Haladaptatus litoreus]